MTLEEFEEILKEQWENISFHESESENILIMWEIENSRDKSSNIFLSGILYSNMQKIFIVGESELCILFSLWFRSILSPSNNISLTNDDRGFIIEIENHTNIHQVVNRFTSEITDSERVLIKTLISLHGKTRTDVLLGVLRREFNDVTEHDFDVLIGQSISSLWDKGLISYPGTRWMSMDVKNIPKPAFDYITFSCDVLLTELGMLATKYII